MFGKTLKFIKEKTLIRTRLRKWWQPYRQYWIPLWTGRKSRTEVKLEYQVNYWKMLFEQSGGKFKNDFYGKKYMARGGVTDDEFFRDKVVMDLGSGPMGSLEFCKKARLRIGLDPLTVHYSPFGIFQQHEMIYLSATGENIPLRDETVDVLFTVNSLDHVENLQQTMRELRRVLRPNGFLLGAINLNHKPTLSEPWSISTELLERDLFDGYEKQHWEFQYNEKEKFEELWFRFKKPESEPHASPLKVVA